MADIMSAQKRSAVMARIRGKDTQPELLARRALHAMGYRYRLYRRDLPGTPDIVFPESTQGCFRARLLLAWSLRMPTCRDARDASGILGCEDQAKSGARRGRVSATPSAGLARPCYSGSARWQTRAKCRCASATFLEAPARRRALPGLRQHSKIIAPAPPGGTIVCIRRVVATRSRSESLCWGKSRCWIPSPLKSLIV